MSGQRYAEVARAGARGGGRPSRGGRGGPGAGRGGERGGAAGAAAATRGAGRGPLKATQTGKEAAPRSAQGTPTHDERFVFAFAVAVNREVTVQLKGGSKYEGVFHGPALGEKDMHIVLNNARKIAHGERESGPLPGDVVPSIVIRAPDFVQMNIKGVAADLLTHRPTAAANGVHEGKISGDITEAVQSEANGGEIAGFEGDREKAISQKGLIDRDLVQWDGGADSGEHCILEDSKDQKSFDQFKGTNSTFKWDTYTSKLDPSKSRYSVAEATRIAGEIEGEEPKSDAHVTSEQRYRTAPDDSGLDEETLFSAVADPPKTAEDQISKPEKKQFSWADAVRGKANRAPAVQESQNVQPSQPSTPLNARWGPKSAQAQPDVDEQTSMKTLSLPSSMIAKERQLTRDQMQNTTESRSSEKNGVDKQRRLTSTSSSDNQKNSAPLDKVGKDVDKVSPKTGIDQKQQAYTQYKENGNIKDVPEAGLANQPTSRIENWGDDESEDDAFFDKPVTSTSNSAGFQGDKQDNFRQRDRIAEAKKSQAVAPNVWKSKGNPWTGKAAQTKAEGVNKTSTKTPTSKISPSAGEGLMVPAPVKKQSPTNTFNDERTKISPAGETSSTTAESIEKKVAPDVRGAHVHESKQQLDAFAAVDAALHQAAVVPVARGYAKTQGPGPTRPTTNTKCPSTQPQSTNAKTVSSRVQPGISWSQKVKESLARDAAKVQPRGQAQTPGKEWPWASKPTGAEGCKQGSLDADMEPSKPSEQMKSRPESSPPKSGASESCDKKDGDPPQKSAKKEKSQTNDQPRQHSSSAANSTEVDASRKAVPSSADKPVVGDKRGSTGEQGPALGSPLNSAGLSATAGVEPVTSEDKVRQGPAPPQPPPKTQKGKSVIRAHKLSSASSSSGIGMQRMEHNRRAQRDGRDKQLNPNAPPFQPPMYPYPIAMYDPVHMHMYMNEMAMSMGAMPHPGHMYPPHCPPRDRRPDSNQSPGNGIQQPPVPPQMQKTGTGVMLPPAPPREPTQVDGQEQKDSNSSGGEETVTSSAPISGPKPPGDPSTKGDNKSSGQEHGADSGGQNQGQTDSSVVTPWPSFPGGGVWHSDQRPMHNGQQAMMSSYMPGMPGPFPMWPGMPYYPAGVQQDPAMWARAAMGPMHPIDPSHPGMPAVYGGNHFGPHHGGRGRSHRNPYGNHRGRGRNNGRDSRKNPPSSADVAPIRTTAGGRAG